MELESSASYNETQLRFTSISEVLHMTVLSSYLTIQNPCLCGKEYTNCITKRIKNASRTHPGTYRHIPKK